MPLTRPNEPPLFVLEPRAIAREDGETFDEYIDKMATHCAKSWGNGHLGHFSGAELLRFRRLRLTAPEPPDRLVPNIVGALWLAEGARAEFGPLAVGYGYRPRALNRRVGGAWRSRHIKFRAIDLDLPKNRRDGPTMRAFYEWGIEAWLEFGAALKMGIGLYRPRGGRRQHFDTGSRRRHWRARYTSPLIRELR